MACTEATVSAATCSLVAYKLVILALYGRQSRCAVRALEQRRWQGEGWGAKWALTAVAAAKRTHELHAMHPVHAVPPPLYACMAIAHLPNDLVVLHCLLLVLSVRFSTQRPRLTRPCAALPV